MPSVPAQNKCQHLGCKNTKSKLNPFCSEHGGRNYTQARDGDSLYQTAAWKRTRVAQLSRQPLCQACLLDGRVEGAKHIDHVFPWRLYGRMAFTRNILQSLCPEHHSHKTGQEKQGVFMHYTQEGVAQYTQDDYNRVMHKSVGTT